MCVKEPLVGPPSRYVYADNARNRVARDDFTGPSALAQRVPSKGKWRVPCDEKNRPLCDVFAIRFKEGDYSQTVWTDQRAMKFWRDHNEVIEFLREERRERTTHSILRTWEDTLDTLHALWAEDTDTLDGGGDPADYDEPPEEDSSDSDDDEDGETQGSSSQGNGVMDVDDDDDEMEDVI